MGRKKTKEEVFSSSPSRAVVFYMKTTGEELDTMIP